jgi:tetraacyldisaccharide 4'-kinase
MSILSPLAYVYGTITRLRNRMYDAGTLRSHPLGRFTISVGNLTTGGTGKTPLVAMIAEELAAKGERVCILTRGYGRADAGKRVLVSDGEQVLADAAEGGDEPVELAMRLLGKAVVVADADRVAAATWALENFEITVFILDDGFQHRRAKRDVDIVCIDARVDPRTLSHLPAGPLREDLRGASRADVIVLTRSDQSEITSDIEHMLREVAPRAVIVRAQTMFDKVISLETFLNAADAPDQTQAIKTDRLLAFCGLADPQPFSQQLSNAGFNIVNTRAFADHHRYDQQDISMLESLVVDAGAAALVTTAKDAVKLGKLKFSRPCYVVMSSCVVNDREELMRAVSPSS